MARAFYPHHITDDSALGGMEIKRSWRVEQGTADVNSGSNFYRTFGSGNRRTFTTSVWVKKCDTPGNIGDDQYAIFTAGGGGSGSSSLHLYFYNDDRLQYSGGFSGSADGFLIIKSNVNDDTSGIVLKMTNQNDYTNHRSITCTFVAGTIPNTDEEVVQINFVPFGRRGSSPPGPAGTPGGSGPPGPPTPPDTSECLVYGMQVLLHNHKLQ